MSEFKAHLFICTNSPDKKGRCGHKDAEQLRRGVKELVGEQSWSKEVRINSAGCLGHCERGIAAVLYPQNKWLFDLENSNSDAKKLFNAVEAAVKDSRHEISGTNK